MQPNLPRARALALVSFVVVACDSSGSGSLFSPDGSVPDTDGHAITDDPHSVCDALIRCYSATSHDIGGVDGIIDAYGKSGSCWGAFPAADCRAQCLTAIAALHQSYPSEGSCNVCDSAEHCNERAGLLCSTETHRCYECNTDDDCLGKDGQRLCDNASGSCVGCLSRDDCPSYLPSCDPTNRWCTECDTDADCAQHGEGRSACDLTTHLCVACFTDQYCEQLTDGEYRHCKKDPEGRPLCYPCKDSTQCPAEAPICSSLSFCYQCLQDSDCVGFGGDTSRTFYCSFATQEHACTPCTDGACPDS